jgi:hypothetical protein
VSTAALPHIGGIVTDVAIIHLYQADEESSVIRYCAILSTSIDYFNSAAWA